MSEVYIALADKPSLLAFLHNYSTVVRMRAHHCYWLPFLLLEKQARLRAFIPDIVEIFPLGS